MSDLLQDLNDEQHDAVKYMDGPLLVLAGPGTGKTRVTCSKMAHLIRDLGYKPQEILALTFSDRAAQEMQLRIEELLPEVTEIQVSTFHSFCYHVVKDHSLELGIDISGPIITDDHQQAFFLTNLDQLGIETFKVPARPVELAKILQGAVTRFKQENISITKLEAYLKRKKDEGTVSDDILKLIDLAKAYRAYEEFKQEKGLLDFGDMQFYALSLFDTHPVILRKYQDQLRYIIVDEFQDNDFIQLELLFRLSPSGSITIVGDDDQAIYRFRGAYLTNIHSFRTHYMTKGLNPRTIVLKTNYRCTGNIQTVAHNLIRNNVNRGDKEIITQKGSGSPVQILRYENDWEQSKGITQMILEIHNAGRSWNDIAILVRKRSFAGFIIENLSKAGIPFEILGSRYYFQQEVVKTAVAYLKVLEDPIKYQPSLGKILHRPVHGIHLGEIPQLGKYAKQNRISLWEALGDLSGFKGTAIHFNRLKEELDRYYVIKGEQGLLALVRAILFGNDLFRIEISHNNVDNIRLLNRFLVITTEFLAIYPDGNLNDFLLHLEALASLGIEDRSIESTTGCVHLLTVHGAKGKQFPVVFIPSVNQNKFPSRYRGYAIEIPEELIEGVQSGEGLKELHLQEERRLLYVGITRGEEEVLLCSCKRFDQNKKDTPMSPFLKEIMNDTEGFELSEITDIGEEFENVDTSDRDAIYGYLINQIQRSEWEEALSAFVALAQYQDQSSDILDLEMPRNIDLTEYRKKLNVMKEEPGRLHLTDVVYYPTNLKTYEECPMKYYYKYVLKIPGISKSFFSLGTAVHAVCEHVGKELLKGNEVSETEALRALDEAWNAAEYESGTKEQQDKAEAETMVRKFLARQSSKETRILDVERWIKVKIQGREFRGKVDRIDLDNDNSLIVYDYKSSKSQTSRPELKRDFQMALYTLGVRNAYGKPVKQVGHWYLRMDKEWLVEMSKEELDAVVERAVGVAEGVENGEFGATPGYQACMYCDYKVLCDRSDY